MINYYSVLGVSNFAAHEDIKTAHRKLSKQWHPDLNGGSAYHAEKFKEIQAAYECLRNPGKREFYDYKLMSFLNGNTTNTTADPHYTYTTYRQPVYQKERTTDWFTPRMFFRVAYITILLFQIYTCDQNDSSNDFYRVNQPIQVTIETTKTAQEILDSFAKAGRVNDSADAGNPNSIGGAEQNNTR